MEEVAACDLCGGTAFKPRARFPEYLLFTGDVFTLVTCAGCELSFVNPRPTREAVGRFYGDDYFAHRGDQPTPVAAWQRQLATRSPAELGWLRRFWLRIRQDVAWYGIPRERGDRRILDLGCGSGKLLDIMRGMGWQTYGADVSTSAIERARAKGHQGVIGGAEDRHFAGETFDVVYMWHALEHCHAPAKALANVHDSLRPGGQFMLCVPNFNSAQSKIFGKYWWSSDAPRHLFQFTRKTVRRYLTQAGFKNIVITTRTGPTSWVRAFRHTINGWFGTRLQTDPDWLVDVFTSWVVAGSLVRYYGVGCELRVTCER
jgi:2-polyprenyl-3-methyl-5-hydroxy-6-metoxy-1,4-benzoquinol methylase